ncbi:hypothetical protein BU24DRAFT_461573 [Aaosphaeria arxii CBS 175.79]|uniref:Uncharacterized protein n=1 Tax=Aaosphaeria arxii CBS 175.79 TaxID=1450172 RepID=A0A6A5XQ86_9PLEO|nr:uncharacterized protein BU24DRAFT_461573 [Aaosphaeria arxii CBS 175.79]KAF2015322.1 hypothetical protein BU24DRAFT_461573 [Aaosphaeria arxii CBS 175.79]
MPALEIEDSEWTNGTSSPEEGQIESQDEQRSPPGPAPTEESGMSTPSVSAPKDYTYAEVKVHGTKLLVYSRHHSKILERIINRQPPEQDSNPPMVESLHLEDALDSLSQARIESDFPEQNKVVSDFDNINDAAKWKVCEHGGRISVILDKLLEERANRYGISMTNGSH